MSTSVDEAQRWDFLTNLIEGTIYADAVVYGVFRDHNTHKQNLISATLRVEILQDRSSAVSPVRSNLRNVRAYHDNGSIDASWKSLVDAGIGDNTEGPSGFSSDFLNNLVFYCPRQDARNFEKS